MRNEPAMKKPNEFLDTSPLEELGKRMMQEEKRYVIKKVIDPEELYKRTKKEIESVLH